jgi:thioredoxin reductase
MHSKSNKLPVAVIGGGPIGLSAAVHLLKQGLTPIVFESGDRAGANLACWGHVRMFSPWSFNMDAEAVVMLKKEGWREPDANSFPTGKELLDDYLTPLACHREISAHLNVNTKVISVSRLNHDVMRTSGRDTAAFVLRTKCPKGERDVLAQGVIDASGTYNTPNWLGTHGIPALGENMASDAITYGVPNVLGAASEKFANKTVLVVGGGHSAFNALKDLILLSDEYTDTRVLWGVRNASVTNVVRSPVNDELKERRRLELHIQALLESGRIEVFPELEIDTVEQKKGQLAVQSGSRTLPAIDQIIAATGFRPALNLLSELRTSFDATTQSPVGLAPLIDPNLHSCGSVPEHGYKELAHPEKGLFIVGIKSYGRTPTFLLKTGYKQVKSVVRAISSGDAYTDREVRTTPKKLTCPNEVAGD